MRHRHNFTKNIILIVTVFLFANLTAEAADAGASGAADRFKTMVAQKLTERLRADLSAQSVDVRIERLQNEAVSPSEISLDGRAVALVKEDKTALPLEFNAKINPETENLDDISYAFVESPSEFGPSATESSLMKNLMTEISKDYETKNIVISIDGFDAAKLSTNETQYEGIGEVRIGDLEWSKIKFNIVLDSQGRRATKILYEVRK
jgi:hypothetical protein